MPSLFPKSFLRFRAEGVIQSVSAIIRIMGRRIRLSWVAGAFASAFFAGITSILAKCGIKTTDPDIATALRTCVVFVFAWAMAALAGPLPTIGEISGRSWLFLVLSGLATGGTFLMVEKKQREHGEPNRSWLAWAIGAAVFAAAHSVRRSSCSAPLPWRGGRKARALFQKRLVFVNFFEFRVGGRQTATRNLPRPFCDLGK